MADAVAEFAALLALLKDRSGRSFAALARRSGQISGSTLHRYCRGEGVPPDYAVVDRIARACQANPAQLAELRRRWLLADYHRRLTQDTATPPAPEPAVPVPRQLPAGVPHFAGRTGELAALTALAGQTDGPGRAVVISAIGGTAGIGKTALAVHWAHHAAARFPDGQLYADLRGFDPTGQAALPDEVLRAFLTALGVDPKQIPAGLAEQVGLYRSTLAGRRVLVLLDNARDSAQVRPLLPGTARCLVLVTSRNRLDSLVAVEGAHPVTLDLLSNDEARQVLEGRLSRERVAAEPAAVTDLIDRCARLPLALSIVAARAAIHPGFALTALRDELLQDGPALDGLSGGEPSSDVRTVLSWSYRALSPPAARLFRLLGIVPGPDATLPAAASLAGLPTREARVLLAELARAHLITERLPGRYSFHDLLRGYAAELGQAEPEPAATRRLLDHYLHGTHAAVVLLHPASEPVTGDPYADGVTLPDLPDPAAAMAWLIGEHRSLLAAVEHAAAHGFDQHAWQLASTVATFLDRRGHWHDLIRTGTAAVGAGERLGDRSAQARAHRSLGLANARLSRIAQAHHHLGRAVELFAAAGDRVGEAYSHLNRAFGYDRQGQPADALRHAETAAALFAEVGHAIGQAQSLNTVGWHHAQLGHYERALDHCGQALTLLRRLGHRNGEADTLDSLGYAHRKLRQYPQAADCYRAALDLYRDLGDRSKEANTLDCLAQVYAAAGDPGPAGKARAEAATIRAELDHPAG